MTHGIEVVEIPDTTDPAKAAEVALTCLEYLKGCHREFSQKDIASIEYAAMFLRRATEGKL